MRYAVLLTVVVGGFFSSQATEENRSLVPELLSHPTTILSISENSLLPSVATQFITIITPTPATSSLPDLRTQERRQASGNCNNDGNGSGTNNGNVNCTITNNSPGSGSSSGGLSSDAWAGIGVGIAGLVLTILGGVLFYRYRGRKASWAPRGNVQMMGPNW